MTDKKQKHKEQDVPIPYAQAKTCVITWSSELANRFSDELAPAHVEVRPSLERALREPAQAYIVDTQVEDMDLWPAPLLVDPEAKKKPWLFLLSTPDDLPPMEESPREVAFFGREAESAPEVRSYLEKRLGADAGRRLSKVDYIRQAKILIVHFESGRCYALDLVDIAGADDTEAAQWEIGEGRDYLKITQRSGNVLEVPWDAVLYHCEPKYAYYKGRQEPGAEPPLARARRIGARVRDLRTARGMTSTQLAERSGMQRPNLSRLESGKHVPSLETLERVAEALDVPVARLVAVQTDAA